MNDSCNNCYSEATVFIIFKCKKYDWPKAIVFCEKHWNEAKLYYFDIEKITCLVTKEKYIKYMALL